MVALAVRLGDGRRINADFAKEHILDAALRCYQRHTFQKTRMEHVASEAKISRTTIYRYFDSRQDVAFGVIFRELYKLLESVTQDSQGASSFAEFIVEALAGASDLASNSPVFNLLMKEPPILISHVYTNTERIFSIAGNLFKPRFEIAHAAGELRAGISFETFANWIMQVGTTYIILFPADADSNSFRKLLWQFLVPSIVREEAIPSERRNG